VTQKTAPRVETPHYPIYPIPAWEPPDDWPRATSEMSYYERNSLQAAQEQCVQQNNTILFNYVTACNNAATSIEAGREAEWPDVPNGNNIYIDVPAKEGDDTGNSWSWKMSDIPIQSPPLPPPEKPGKHGGK